MAKRPNEEVYKEKFRADVDAALDQEIEAALGDLSVDQLMDTDSPAPAKPSGGGEDRGGRGGDKTMKVGKIVSVGKDDVFVDFGGKSQGIVPALQFEEEPKVGDEMEFHVERYDAAEGLLILSRKGSTATNVSWENLEVGQVVEATVTGTNKGGLELEVKKMRAFMPAGQVELFHVPDFAEYVGKKMLAEVTQFEREGRNLVLSRRNVLEREREEQKQKLMAELAEEQIRRGTVRTVMDFGAFVDLGGVDGLLHVSEMTFRRGRQNAAEFVKVGDVLDVKILKIDRETGKLSLSLKQARGIDSWNDAATKYAVGTTLTGRVTKVEPFGAFVEVEEGIEGLLPISEMSWQRIRHPSDVVKVGDTVKLVVLSIDTAARRMSFSLKQAGPDPWKTVEERYVRDMVVDGTITRVVDFGAFVELEPGLEGLVHVSELSDKHVRAAGDVVKYDQAVKVRVLEIDKENRRMGLSMKQVAAAMPKTAEAGAAGQAQPAAKSSKKRPQLRGGLDF
ncbi:MAG TPA: S1 RNA-binding domain-containing protein [Tepidisphaeraceae bacterium]